MKNDYLDLIEDETTRQRRDQFNDSLRRLQLERTPVAGSKLATHEQRPALEHLQASADRLFQMHGVIMPAPRKDDTLNDYRVTLLNEIQHNMPRKLVLPAALANHPEDLDMFETRFAKAAEEAAHRLPVLKPILFKDQAGRAICEWIGKKASWMNRFKAPAQLMVEIGGVPTDQTAELG